MLCVGNDLSCWERIVAKDGHPQEEEKYKKDIDRKYYERTLGNTQEATLMR
jgi:hypothetical protein